MKEHARYENKLNFVAHSFGGLVALSVIKEMQHSNKVHLCSMDSTPHAMKFVIRASLGDISDRAKFENDLLVSTLHWMKVHDTKRVKYSILNNFIELLSIYSIAYLFQFFSLKMFLKSHRNGMKN